MDTEIMRAALVFACLLGVAACDSQQASLSAKNSSPFSENMPGPGTMSLPGLSDLWGESKAEKADDDWWSKYYGGK